ncbi:lateral signaling target protein 2 homolog [Mya arenaria]|uniref:lateral signaling target protein 2 homolog n=1 Tax=Mya arenaria TaxID=6604 RepID=UPI0022E0D61F|nr:lateral signaling target protein 2 homolog [Mya arenaria]
MNSFRRWLYKPKKNDSTLLANFYFADDDLNQVAAELDSFDGRKDPERCTMLVNQLRVCQDKVLTVIQRIMNDAIPTQRASRDFRVKFPDDVLQESLAGQLWFGAECLAAGSSILNREVESASMRPLARALTKNLDSLRGVLREQCLRSCTEYTWRIQEALVIFDKLFAEFELSYVSAMVPVKTMKEYDMLQEVTVLFSETVHRALQLGLLSQDTVDDCDPALMFTIPRLAIVSGLLVYPEGPLNPDMEPTNMTEMFRPFQTLLQKIRELLHTLSELELSMLEKSLCSCEEPDVPTPALVSQSDALLHAGGQSEVLLQVDQGFHEGGEGIVPVDAISLDINDSSPLSGSPRTPVNQMNSEPDFAQISPCSTLVDEFNSSGMDDNRLNLNLNKSESQDSGLHSENVSTSDTVTVDSPPAVALEHDSPLTCVRTATSDSRLNSTNTVTVDSPSSVSPEHDSPPTCVKTATSDSRLNSAETVMDNSPPAVELDHDSQLASVRTASSDSRLNSAGTGTQATEAEHFSKDQTTCDTENICDKDTDGDSDEADSVCERDVEGTANSSYDVGDCKPVNESSCEQIGDTSIKLNTGNSDSTSCDTSKQSIDSEVDCLSQNDSIQGATQNADNNGSLCENFTEQSEISEDPLVKSSAEDTVGEISSESSSHPTGVARQFSWQYNVQFALPHISLNQDPDMDRQSSGSFSSDSTVSEAGHIGESVSDFVIETLANMNMGTDRSRTQSSQSHHNVLSKRLDTMERHHHHNTAANHGSSSSSFCPQRSREVPDLSVPSTSHQQHGSRHHRSSSKPKSLSAQEKRDSVENISCEIGAQSDSGVGVCQAETADKTNESSLEEHKDTTNISQNQKSKHATNGDESDQHTSVTDGLNLEQATGMSNGGDVGVVVDPGSGGPGKVGVSLDGPVLKSEEIGDTEGGEELSMSCSSCQTSSIGCDCENDQLCTCIGSETSSYNSDGNDEEEVALAIRAAESASRNEIRARFCNSTDLIHRLFVCIAGVADQLQTNYASDLRHILKCVFEMHTSDDPIEDTPPAPPPQQTTPDTSNSPSTHDPAVPINQESPCNGMSPNNQNIPETTSQSGPIQPDIQPRPRATRVSSSPRRIFDEPPEWVPDEEAERCTACKTSFTFVRRRHHCRNCGKIFCWKCSSTTVPLPQYGHQKPVRVCHRCFLYQVSHFTATAQY